ncbi:MAG: AAA family ATPase [Nanoarchaeota archaeon]|nr:AAA family ATPase [Nanoarchaeota archaeon]
MKVKKQSKAKKVISEVKKELLKINSNFNKPKTITPPLENKPLVKTEKIIDKPDIKGKVKPLEKPSNKKGFDEVDIEGKEKSLEKIKPIEKLPKKGFDEVDIEGKDKSQLLKKQTKYDKIQQWKGFDKFSSDKETQEVVNIPVRLQPTNLKNIIKDIRRDLQHDLGFHAIEESGTINGQGEGYTGKDKKEILKQRKPVEKVLEGVEFVVKKKNKIYMRTGVPGFDYLFEKGIPVGSSILVAGGAGSGKTIMCLQIFNNACKQGKKCLYMSFEESEDRLREHMNDFGWDYETFEKKKLLYIRRFNPFDITRSVDALLEKAKGELMIEVDPVILPTGFKPDLIVVDSLTAIASAFTGAREASYRVYIEQLFRFLEQIDATSFLITETEQMPKIFSQTGVEEFLADGVIVLYKIKRNSVRENAIEVLKLRGAAHQKKIVAMQITSEGVIVYPEQEVYVSTDES